jgi:hypothetical protein
MLCMLWRAVLCSAVGTVQLVLDLCVLSLRLALFQHSLSWGIPLL